MLIRFSPLVSALSGRAADVVAATWKGRAYVRKYVIPFNPQSTDQTLVRNAFAACVTLWRSLREEVKTFLDTYGVGYRMSGYNVFIGKNRAAQQAETALSPVPANPRVAVPSDLVYDSEPLAGQCKITWTDPELENYTKVFICYRDKDNTFFSWSGVGIAAAAETWMIGGLTIGQTYQIFVGLYNDETNDFGTTGMVEHLQAT